MGVLYKLNREEPNNPEVLLLGGAGSMSLETLKMRVTRRLLDVAEMINDAKAALSWRIALNRVETGILNDLRTIDAANTELEELRKAGGVKSRGIKKA